MDKIIEFKNKLKKQKIKGLALDIDETLSWTIGYWVEKMQIKFGNPENLSVQEMVRKYRYAQNVPYWHHEEAYKWIIESVYSDKLQEALPLIENSNHIIQKINKIIPIVTYITTRPEEVLSGTKKWLKKHGFPNAEILARPRTVQHKDGNKWKSKILDFLYPEVIGIIDDNPDLVDLLSKNYKGIIFLYDNTDHPRKDIAVIPCKTWDDVLNKIKETKMLV